METLEQFVSRIDEFDKKKASELIDYFSFYLLKVTGQNSVNAPDIEYCFDELEIKKYSNIQQYFRNSLRGKQPKFLKKKDGYILSRSRSKEILAQLGITQRPEASSKFFSLNILKNTRGYIENIAEQVIICYDIGVYDGSLVLLRKLIETLIIELFEKNNIENKIKGKDGHYLYLSDLIPKLIDEKTWNLSRNTTKSLPRIKKYGDLSAHNRRFSADKNILDGLKDDIRLVIEELVHMIKY